jgi:prophage DNA circulation protein
MRYKTFVWPHNPERYSISCERRMALHEIPFGGYRVQELGQARRVVSGEGDFAGQDAYETFKKLAGVYYAGGAGTLTHPVWQGMQAYFVSLTLTQEPREDYVRYAFAFWEALPGVADAVLTRKTETAGTAESAAGWYDIVAGDTLWGIALRYDTSVEKLLSLNPSIRNPNLIAAGARLRIS